MELRDLVEAILAGELLRARQWVADARREGIDWEAVGWLADVDDRALVVGAAVAELLAARAGSRPPSWTSTVGAHQEPIVLDPGLESMPRSFAYAKSHGPAPFRNRNLIVLPDFLDVA